MTENIAHFVNIKSSKSRRYKFNDELRQKHFKDYNKSGLSIKDYCKLNDISQSVLRKWIIKFSSKPTFVPISQKMTAPSSNKQSFEIILANGVRVRFPELTNIAVIKQLIREIASCN